VRITELMHAIKNVAVRHGYIHPSFRSQVALLEQHGRLYDITSFENERRIEQGLPAITERAEDFPPIFAVTGLNTLIPPDRGETA
jgi:heterodisulfide reductase subunit C